MVTTEDGGFEDTCDITVIQTATGVTVSPVSFTINYGKSHRLIATISPSNAVIKDVTWSSSNSAVATVDENGVVTAVSHGAACITATTVSGGHQAQCDITVTQPVTGVAISHTKLSLNLSNTYQLTATISPSNAVIQDIIWNSSDSDVAKVDANGMVTAEGFGTARITVTTLDGGFRAYCDITVKEESDYKYQILADGTIEITEYMGSGGDIVIPSKIDGRTVTSIGAWSFNMPVDGFSYPNYSITSASIPASVTHIKDLAFYWCLSLTDVIIPKESELVRIEGAFSRSGLMNINLPASLETLCLNTFYGTNLISITIPEKVNGIDYYTFAGCGNLSTVTFLGDAPVNGLSFDGCADGLKITYDPAKTGWSTPSWMGSPCYPMGEALPTDLRTAFQKTVAMLEERSFDFPAELQGNPAGIIAFLESEISVVADGTGISPIDVRQWELGAGGDGEYYLMNLYGDGVPNYKLNVTYIDLTPDLGTPFQKAVTLIEGRVFDIPDESSNNPSGIIVFLQNKIAAIISGTGLSPIDVRQWELSAGGDGEFYLMNLYGDGVSNYKLNVIIAAPKPDSGPRTPFQKAIALLEGYETIEIPMDLQGYPVEIIAFLKNEIAAIIGGSGFTAIDIQQWAVNTGGDGCFYLMDPDRAANNNYKINTIGH